jgi:hypothetical protein
MATRLDENEKRATNAQMRWALPQAETCSEEQSTPRHKDLGAGIWMRAVRRAIQFITHRFQNSSASYSQAGRRASSSSFSSSIFSRIFEDEDDLTVQRFNHSHFPLRFVLKPE